MEHTPQAILEYGILGEEKKVIIMPVFKAEIELKIKDKKGNVKFEKRQPFKSYIGNFSYILNYAFCNQEISGGILKTDGNAATSTTYAMNIKETSKTSPSTSSYGIWIGNVTGNSGISGLTSNSNMGSIIQSGDYALNTLIPVSSDIEYGDTNVTIENGNILNVNRMFVNNGSAIKISEIGLVAKTNNNEYVLIARDRFNDGTNNYIEIPDSYIIDISYKFKVTAVSGWTENFIAFLSSHFNNGNSIMNARDSIGGSYLVDFQSMRTNQNVMAAIDETNYGLLVGGHNFILDEDKLPSLVTTRYSLANKLTNTYLTHGEVKALNTTGLTYSTNYSIFGIQRDFTNPSSTDTIYVYETGFFLNHNTTSRQYMISRLLTEGSGIPYIAVQPNKILRIKYYLAFPIDKIEVTQ